MNEKLFKLKKDAEFIASGFDEKYCKISEEYMIELDKNPYEKKWNYILEFLEKNKPNLNYEWAINSTKNRIIEIAAICHNDIYWRNNFD